MDMDIELIFLPGKAAYDHPSYIVYPNGDIYSSITRNFINPVVVGTGYKVLSLYNSGKRTRFYHHILVAKTFIPNPLNLPVVNHIDKNRANNSIENLEWVTYKENSKHAVKGRKNKTQIVFQFSLSGKFLKEFVSIKEASKQTEVSCNLICAVLNGRQKTAGGFVWRKEKNFDYKVPEIIDLTDSVILKDFPKYHIFRDGRIYSDFCKRILQPTKGEYLTLSMVDKSGNSCSVRAHVIIALAYCPNPKKLPVVNHLDGNKHNNAAENLEWTTYSGNTNHAWDNNLIKKSTRKGKFYKKGRRKVAKYTREGMFIEEYISIKEASKQNKICKSAISDVCRGSKAKTAGGFIWKYVDN